VFNESGKVALMSLYAKACRPIPKFSFFKFFEAAASRVCKARDKAVRSAGRDSRLVFGGSRKSRLDSKYKRINTEKHTTSTLRVHTTIYCTDTVKYSEGFHLLDFSSRHKT
jgi:hypothetical protein